MIKNTALKNILINTVFKGISSVNAATPKIDRQILFYSDLGFRDNIRALFDYAISIHLNEHYRLVCAVSDYKDWSDKAGELKNVSFVSPLKGVTEYLRSGHVYYCFGKLPIRPARGQTVCQMWHGTSFKGFAKDQVNSVSRRNQFYTHVFASSEYFRPIVEEKFQCLPDRVVINGHPRTDVFYHDTQPYDLGQYKKLIVWLPTFRKSSSVAMADGKDELIPLFDSAGLKELDRKLRENEVRMIVKLHPVQDTSGLDRSSFTNLEVMTNAEFNRKGYELYRLLKQSDALITDYSSVFYDYLLLDRPIGFTEDDLQLYADSRGFAVDPDKFRPGARLRTENDVYQFIEDVAAEKDGWGDARKEINDLSNAFQDGQNARRAFTLCGVRIPASKTR